MCRMRRPLGCLQRKRPPNGILHASWSMRYDIGLRKSLSPKNGGDLPTVCRRRFSARLPTAKELSCANAGAVLGGQSDPRQICSIANGTLPRGIPFTALCPLKRGGTKTLRDFSHLSAKKISTTSRFARTPLASFQTAFEMPCGNI